MKIQQQSCLNCTCIELVDLLNSCRLHQHQAPSSAASFTDSRPVCVVKRAASDHDPINQHCQFPTCSPICTVITRYQLCSHQSRSNSSSSLQLSCQLPLSSWMSQVVKYYKTCDIVADCNECAHVNTSHVQSSSTAHVHQAPQRSYTYTMTHNVHITLTLDSVHMRHKNIPTTLRRPVDSCHHVVHN